jgi:hypothetical protein
LPRAIVSFSSSPFESLFTLFQAAGAAESATTVLSLADILFYLASYTLPSLLPESKILPYTVLPPFILSSQVWVAPVSASRINLHKL